MKKLLDRIKNGEVVVADGAWGTMLMARGLPPGDPPESFNLARPDVLEAIAREYLDAGAEVITTNTFGASPVRLRLHGLEDQTEAINRAGVEAARRAAGSRAYVSASVGPTGLMLKPYGEADHADIAFGYERQIRALVSAGVDLICIETMTDLTEAVLALRAARACAPEVPVLAALTFEKTRRGFFTVMGASLAQAARALSEAGADIVGSNCGNGIDLMVEVARELRGYTHRPLAIRSNAGLPEQRGDGLVYPETPEFMASRALTLADVGVTLIGGCCGTTPDHIRAIREALADPTAA